MRAAAASARGRASEGGQQVDEAVAGGGEIEGGDPPCRLFLDAAPEFGIPSELLDAVGQGVGVQGVDQHAGIADDLGQGAGPVGDHGEPHGHRLDDGHPESFML